ncbi:MAG TPA: hypothetical protein VFC44_18545 [Candidatus Saccharimonadales bacterium]|nr:hypothetical protein [Candidatus Saccharimonadales bacterium]
MQYGRVLKAVVILAFLCAFSLKAREVELRLGKDRFQFEVDSEAGLRRLDQEVSGLIAQERTNSAHASGFLLSLAKKNHRGLAEMQRLAEEALRARESQRHDLIDNLLEITAAVNNSQRPPLPARLDVLQMPFGLWQMFRPVGRGKAPATDLPPGSSADLSRRDPLPNPFWRRPADIPSEDLSNGFGRQSFPFIKGEICDYDTPKESYGMNPGYEVNCNGAIVKLKFGEISSEPFVTRIFWALGFHADATDYSPGVKVHYDRRIFQEFNSRREVKTRFTFLGFLPFYTMKLQKRHDPFDYIAQAVLRDGRAWTGRELKEHLLRDSVRPRGEMAASNFRPEVEAQIAYLLTVAANVQAKAESVKSVGPWDYGQLDHAGRREVRGAGLLAAWVGFFDARADNTRVRLVGPKKHPQAVNYFSDLGGGMGRTSGLFSWHGENAVAFPWTFTRPSRGPRKLRITGYKTIAPNPAFAAMTLDDARWMARLIAQLSENQIVAALTASGYSPEEVRLYTKKLLNRREHMIADLGLGGEDFSRPDGAP